MLVTRRALFAAAALASFATPGTAMAGLRPPLYDPPPQVRPLGRWALLSRRLEVVQAGQADVTIDVPLAFRPEIDVAAPVERWWRRSAVLGIATATRTITPAMAGGLFVDVPISLTIPKATRKGGYRVSCEMFDPDTKRRAVYSFLLQVLGKPRA